MQLGALDWMDARAESEDSSGGKEGRAGGETGRQSGHVHAAHVDQTCSDRVQELPCHLGKYVRSLEDQYLAHVFCCTPIDVSSGSLP